MIETWQLFTSLLTDALDISEDEKRFTIQAIHFKQMQIYHSSFLSPDNLESLYLDTDTCKYSRTLADVLCAEE